MKQSGIDAVRNDVEDLANCLRWESTKNQYVHAVVRISTGIKALVSLKDEDLKREMQHYYENRWDFEHALRTILSGTTL